ncbi:phosphotransferase family protein [Albimonas sp. CAU 1670]|uniref:phosphotransferase family protein n=1 Tax=Albimonas sp. CAU 1670 TaxID=3032599 RepID=UPI0023D9969D|nr:phosphotransferase family protein [Albimonas sp. CAU 1670]MDF2234065.1 phosphotransferase family protein [Albimonas sp. CAU 1670]
MTPADPAWRGEALAPRLAGFIERQVGEPVAVANLHRFTAGLSWATIGFSLRREGRADEALILRIGDPNGLLAPYSARPEHLALSSLAGTPGLPAATSRWWSDDAAVIGAPFIVTSRLEGRTPMPIWPGAAPGAEEAADPAAEDRILDDFVEALAAVHACDWRDAPAAALDPEAAPETCVRDEIARWVARLPGADGRPEAPAMRYAAAWLHEHAPTAVRVALLHGDYRVGNYMVKDGRISGILDWELTHLGDPHEDLAWAGLRTLGGTETTLGGRLDRAEFLRRYSERTGLVIDADRIRYFEVLGQFKAACLLLMARERVRRGAVHDARLAVMGLQPAAAQMGLMSMIKAIRWT